MGTRRGRGYAVLAAVALAVGAAAAYGADVHVGAHAQTSRARAAGQSKHAERTERRAHSVGTGAGADSPPRCTHPDWAPTAVRAYAGMARARRVAVWSRPIAGSVVARF